MCLMHSILPVNNKEHLESGRSTTGKSLVHLNPCFSVHTSPCPSAFPCPSPHCTPTMCDQGIMVQVLLPTFPVILIVLNYSLVSAEFGRPGWGKKKKNSSFGTPSWRNVYSECSQLPLVLPWPMSANGAPVMCQAPSWADSDVRNMVPQGIRSCGEVETGRQNRFYPNTASTVVATRTVGDARTRRSVSKASRKCFGQVCDVSAKCKLLGVMTSVDLKPWTL